MPDAWSRRRRRLLQRQLRRGDDGLFCQMFGAACRGGAYRYRADVRVSLGIDCRLEFDGLRPIHCQAASPNPYQLISRTFVRVLQSYA